MKYAVSQFVSKQASVYERSNYKTNFSNYFEMRLMQQEKEEKCVRKRFLFFFNSVIKSKFRNIQLQLQLY